MRPRWFWLVASPLALLFAAWGVFGYYSSREKHDQADLGQAKTDLVAGRLVAARGVLANLSAAGPTTVRPPTGSDGANKLATTRPPRWRRGAVSPPLHHSRTGPRWVAPASLTDTGRFAAAEAILEALPAGRNPDAPEVRQALELVYRFQGRMNDIRGLIIESWPGAADRPRCSVACSCSSGRAIRPRWSTSCCLPIPRTTESGWQGRTERF